MLVNADQGVFGTALELMWHMQDIQGQILALTFRFKVFRTFGGVSSSLGSGFGKDQVMSLGKDLVMSPDLGAHWLAVEELELDKFCSMP
jgi:hypothetical protein